jgi:hypothetical protein
MGISTTNKSILEIQGQSSERDKICNLNDKSIENVYNYKCLRYYISRNNSKSFNVKLSNFKYMGGGMPKTEFISIFYKIIIILIYFITIRMLFFKEKEEHRGAI